MRSLGCVALVLLVAEGWAQTTVDTRLASEAGGAQGIFIRITVPASARYGSLGAPVVIHVPGGFAPGGLSVASPPWSLSGCIEIRFNFPGGGTGATASGGIYDERGSNCLKALRDIVRFALGLSTDTSGRSLAELVAPIVPLSTNVGMVGWSNGGNATLGVAGVHGSELTGLAWIVNWESPVGDGMANAECGGRLASPYPNPLVNPAYDPNSGMWDMSSLTWDDTLQVAREVPALRGGLYFDINRNGALDTGSDFVLNPHLWGTPAGAKVYYSNRVIREAVERHLLPLPPPSHIASPAETEAFWQYRNAEGWLSEVVRLLPHLMFLVVASETDHVQNAPDHPHVLTQYEGLRAAGARLVRLNPDRAYVEHALGHAVPSAADNDAFVPLDHLTIRSALEPDPNSLPTNVTVAAAIYELADRTFTGNTLPQLDATLTGVEKTAFSSPLAPRLWQNYPNPFSAATIFGFSLGQDAHVQLEVFDLLGRSVAKVVDADLRAGEHSVVLSTEGLPSGSYLCRLHAGPFVVSKTMQILR
ncbi:MAG: T9SS type A sorting domain-containing protein [Calditrichaeota bacterium]|nr:T9SS type A sorting domain-containing protein [Calditrichota bacterium]